MPSPVGHALAGVAAGWLVSGAPRARAGRRDWQRQILPFAMLGVLPDVDLLVGAHSGPTHGIGAAMLAGGVTAAIGPGPALRRLRFGLACALAYGSHILLDWLGTDTSIPIGIMALWPFSRDYYESGLHVFMAISRRTWQGAVFWRQNLLAVARELIILVPLLAVVWRIRGTDDNSQLPTPNSQRT